MSSGPRAPARATLPAADESLDVPLVDADEPAEPQDWELAGPDQPGEDGGRDGEEVRRLRERQQALPEPRGARLSSCHGYCSFRVSVLVRCGEPATPAP